MKKLAIDFSKIKNLNPLLKVITINLFLTFIGLETLSLAFYFLKEKQWFYTRSQGVNTVITQTLEQTGVRLNESIVERLHPYFGYGLKKGFYSRPQLGLKVNNYGLYSRYDYPYVKTNPQQYIIGLFGGSVAHDLALNDYINQNFTKKLKQFPELAKKDIILLNFANGGYKQPQQLLILNYLLALGQKFDLVINLDGFNEIALANFNKEQQVDISMPSIQHYQPLTELANNNLSVANLQLILEIRRTKKQLSKTIDRLENCKLAICYTMNFWQFQRLINHYQAKSKEYEQNRKVKGNQVFNDENSIFIVPTVPQKLNDQIAYNQMADLWYNSSLNMSQILQSQEVPFVHILQPNQYQPTQRKFTEEEKKFYVLQDSPFVEMIRKGYPLLMEKANELRKLKVNVFTDVTIMDNIKETVYRDNCCHFNSLGEEVLDRYVANSVIQVLRLSSTKKE